jgi:hypothetical protein
MLQAHATEPGSGADERSRLRGFEQLTIERLLTTNTEQRLRPLLAEGFAVDTITITPDTSSRQMSASCSCSTAFPQEADVPGTWGERPFARVSKFCVHKAAIKCCT